MPVAMILRRRTTSSLAAVAIKALENVQSHQKAGLLPSVFGLCPAFSKADELSCAAGFI